MTKLEELKKEMDDAEDNWSLSIKKADSAAVAVKTAAGIAGDTYNAYIEALDEE